MEGRGRPVRKCRSRDFRVQKSREGGIRPLSWVGKDVGIGTAGLPEGLRQVISPPWTSAAPLRGGCVKSGRREHYEDKKRESSKGPPNAVSSAWKSLMKESFSHNCSNTATVIALANAAQWAGRRVSRAPKGCWLESGSGHMPGFWARSPVGRG